MSLVWTCHMTDFTCHMNGLQQKNCVQVKILMKKLFFSSSMVKSRFSSSSLPSTPCSFCLEIRSKTDAAPPAKLSFGTLGQTQRKINW